MMADLLKDANATTGGPKRTTVAVQFLDGPLAGTVREIGADSLGNPKIDRITALKPRPPVWEPETAFPSGPLADHVTYHVKRSMFRGAGRGAPKWAAAIGEKVGDRVQCVQTYTHEARTGIRGFDKLIERNAHDQLARTCAEVGLVPTEVRKAFDGDRRRAEAWVYPAEMMGAASRYGDVEQAARAALVASNGYGGWGNDLQFVVYTAVAMPAPEPAVEPVTSWA